MQIVLDLWIRYADNVEYEFDVSNEFYNKACSMFHAFVSEKGIARKDTDENWALFWSKYSLRDICKEEAIELEEEVRECIYDSFAANYDFDESDLYDDDQERYAALDEADDEAALYDELYDNALHNAFGNCDWGYNICGFKA